VIAWWHYDAFVGTSAEAHTLIIIGITIFAAAPRSDFQREQRPEFDEAMKPAEDNRNRQEDDVPWLSPEQRDIFDDLRETEPSEESEEPVHLAISSHISTAVPCKEEKQRVHKKCKRGEGRKVQSIC
jgi:hypothetical protein